MRVHFLAARNLQTFRTHCFLYPTRVFSRALRSAGVETRIFRRHDHPKLTRCDVLAVVCDYWPTAVLLQKADEVVELLEGFRRGAKTLVWCDITDDTGHLFEAAFAKVDLYAKNQVLRDRALYRETCRERGWVGEWFHRHFPEELARLPAPDVMRMQRALEPWEIEKLAVSWNVGLGDFNTWRGRGRALRPWWPLARHAGRVRDAGAERRLALSFRGTTRYPHQAASFHRQEVARRVRELAARRGLAMPAPGLVSRAAYMKELGESAIGVSPFGHGELCWRDFESWLCGALLLKPDMDHLETWPEYYVKGVTYAAHRWDLADLEARIEALLADDEARRRIAGAGQQRYLESLAPTGARPFAERFVAVMREAIERSGASV